MKQNKNNRYMPLLMAVCVMVGILMGTFFANRFSGNRLNIINSGSNRLNNLLHIIDDQYVDKVNIDSLVEKAMPQILAELDPHSVYISAKDVQLATDDLKGSFFGVGIEFVIREDTVHVQGVIANGPAEKAGVIAGDKIISVDDKPFVGKGVTNEEAMKRLKGPKDTKVKIGVMRYGEKKPQYFTITRGEIPMKSVTAAYMLDDETGYVKVKNFGEHTYDEMTIALAKLTNEGLTNLILDLRDNIIRNIESAVEHREKNAFDVERRIVIRFNYLYSIHKLRQSLECEKFSKHGYQHGISGNESIYRQRAECRRTVDEDVVEAVLEHKNLHFQAIHAVFHVQELDLSAREVLVSRDNAEVIELGRKNSVLNASFSYENVVNRDRNALFLNTEAGRSVSLRVDIDAEHLFAALTEIRRKIDNSGRLSNAALLICDGNYLTHTFTLHS